LTPAHMFLLSTLSVDVAGRDSIVLVGEAAHAFPPIGAQGLNLGLRDVADLAAALAATPGTGPDFGRAVAADYARRRAGDLMRTGTVVDTLFRSLLADFLPAQVLRAGGLWALKLAPPLRKAAFDIGMGVRSAQ
ncbi:MAG TPA: FAD-dependent monooxygenase, partial [Devosia sp.]|nr:FAD-dependent monooxygenase [Devosia sp.]